MELVFIKVAAFKFAKKWTQSYMFLFAESLQQMYNKTEPPPFIRNLIYIPNIQHK